MFFFGIEYQMFKEIDYEICWNKLVKINYPYNIRQICF